MITSTVICTLLVGAAFAGPTPHHNEQPPRKPGTPFKLCVPEGAYKPCLKMVEQGKTVGVHMTCVIARDRMDCIEKIENHSADWGAVDPEDMYVAAKYANDLFGVFKEIRTKEEPKNEFRYEAVAVIHKDFEINDLHQLRGLKSCHTGVGRNVGYKIPITKLTNMGVLPPLNNTSISPRENELHALSNFFSKACLVGKWSPDPDTNARWKNQYSNLCQLCEFPEKCDYPDQNSGYEGALRCLTKAGGQVAWTKVIYVKKFFGMPYGTKPERPVEGVNKEDYAYLCPDTTKRPITGPPCTWAARPWQGYVANSEITSVGKDLKELRDEISKLNNLGETEHADWITSVLALNADTNVAVDNNGPYKPQQYLDKANYSDVIERDVIKPARKVRLCVVNPLEKEKCEHLRQAAYSRDIRPQFECVQKSSGEECLNAVKNKEADIVSIDAGHLQHAESLNLEPVTTEIFKSNKTSQHVVAIVRQGNPVTSLNGLKGKKACLGETGTAAGWVIPAYALRKTNAIKTNNCPIKKALSEYFSSIVQSNDPIRCLDKGEGDVAFVGADELEWVKNNIEVFKANEFVLLRLEGGRCEIDKAAECHLASVPARLVVAHKELSLVERDDITFSILSAGKTFSSDPHIFLMFGEYKDEPNVIFSNYANGFLTTHNNNEVSTPINDFKVIASEVNSCSAATKH